MGSVEDIRKVLQDFLAPELRTITARLDALGQIMDSRFEAIESRIESLSVSTNSRFDALNNMTNSRFDSISSEIAQIKELIDVDRRLSRLESKQALVTQ
jgi:phage-related protein